MLFLRASVLILFILFADSNLAQAQSTASLWLREPALSPDGTRIVFTRHGRLFIAARDGDVAVPLTGEHYRSHSPVWSPDGRFIAFAADMTGNDDVYVMPANGGPMVPLTVDSRDDSPLEFTADGSRVIFRSARPALPQYDFYSLNSQSNASLWSATLDGKQIAFYQPLPATRLHHQGNRLLWQMPGADQPWRKHQRSFAVSRIWLQQEGKQIQLTEDRIAAGDPWWTPDGKHIVYLSERSGNFNVWRRNLDTGKDEQLTRYEQHPVRHLSASLNGDLAWSWNGEIYLLPTGNNTPQKQHFTLLTGTEIPLQDLKADLPDDATINRQQSEAILATHGDLFAVDLEKGRSQLLTDTAEEESGPVYLPNGRDIVFISERNGYSALYRLTSDDGEPLSAGGARTETEIFRLPGKDLSQLTLSRDGKKLAFVADGQALYLLSLENNQHRQLVSAEMNPMRHQVSLSFSPDGRYLAFTLQPDTARQDVAVIDTEQSNASPMNVSRNGYRDQQPLWSEDGGILYWQSSRFGALRPDGEPGDPGFVGVFSNRASRGDFLREREVKTPGYAFEAGDPEEMKAFEQPVSGQVIASRLLRDKLIYVTYDIRSVKEEGSPVTAWSLDLRSGENKELFRTQSLSPLVNLDEKGEKLTLINDGEITQIDLNGDWEEKSTAWRLSREREWQQVLNASYQQIARITPKEIFDAGMNGVAWDDYVQNYQRFLPHINNPQDYAILLAELAGELNVSHTWGTALPPEQKNDTASLGGLFLERDGGLTLHSVLAGGPLDTESEVKPGDRLIAINGILVKSLHNLNRYLNHQAGNRQQLTFRRGDEAFVASVTAISQEQEAALLLKAWEKRRRDYVEKRSNGRVGYVHMVGMDENSYSHLVANALGFGPDKKALIVDVRFNGGGYLANTLVEFLSGNGENKGMAVNWPGTGKGAPDSASRQWTRPSVVLANAYSYSEGSAFPRYYKALNIGPVIGEPIPGTGTMVFNHSSRLIPGLNFGIPTLALRAPDGQLYENNEQKPDLFVRFTPENLLKGEDPQLDAAIDQAISLALPGE